MGSSSLGVSKVTFCLFISCRRATSDVEPPSRQPRASGRKKEDNAAASVQPDHNQDNAAPEDQASQPEPSPPRTIARTSRRRTASTVVRPSHQTAAINSPPKAEPVIGARRKTIATVSKNKEEEHDRVQPEEPEASVATRRSSRLAAKPTRSTASVRAKAREETVPDVGSPTKSIRSTRSRRKAA